MLLYFAFGSNMFSRRLQARTPSARHVTVAQLPNHSLAFNKRSVDGSGKCTLVPGGRDRDVVFGVVYQIVIEEQPLLDEVEGLGRGYNTVNLDVLTPEGILSAYAYIADERYVDDNLRPYAWYKALVVAGAIEHGLPPDYVKRLTAVEAWEDPDAGRSHHHIQLLNR